MANSVPKGAEPLGSKLYFFKSTTSSRDVLISAHGGYYKANKTFDVPGTGKDVEIIFYAPHGSTLTDPGMTIMKGDFENAGSVFSGNKCVNYELSKYQGRHGGQPGKPAETYDSIASTVEDEDRRLVRHFERMLAAAGKGNQQMAKGAIDQIRAGRTMNVVTIRNRWNSSDVWLKDVVATVRKAYPGINRFHCSFCRSLVGDNNAPSHTAQLRNPG
jgi:hypothetical protein